MNIQHKTAVVYIFISQKPQIDSCQSLKHAHASGTVPQAVMGLQGNPAPIIIYSHQITVVCFKMHGLTGIFHILLHERPRSVIGLQIAPEQPLPDSRLVGGKPGHRQIKSLLQDLRPDLLLQYHRKPVHGGKIPSLQRRIDDSRQIQLIPFPVSRPFTGFLFFHKYTPKPASRRKYFSMIPDKEKRVLSLYLTLFCRAGKET